MASRALTIGGASYPLILPNVRDPRLHVAAVILSIHVLGQLGLHFRVSVPQILAAILASALLEIAITFYQSRAFVWPASAMLTGSGVALILRVVGTPPDDHWSTYAWDVFAAVAAISLLSKYVIRYRGAPLFNPSNVGLVAAFIFLGSSRAEPLDFWWAPPSAWSFTAYALILIGGVLITGRLGLLALATTFWVALAAGLGILAVAGQCMISNWSFAPVCGADFWRVIVTSPEVFVFLFFMLTDPRTIPAGRVGRVAFGALVAVFSTLFIAPQTDEFGAKVGLLAGLVVMCAARPMLDRVLPAPRSSEDDVRRSVTRLAFGSDRPAGSARAALRLGLAALAVLIVAASIVAAGAPVRGGIASNSAIVDARWQQIDPSTFPATTIDRSVSDWDPSLAGPAMQEVVLALAQNLEVESEALLRADPALLLTVDHGDRLVEMQDRIKDAAAKGTIQVSRYRFDSIDVTLLRPFGRQDGLSLGLKSRGTMTSETYDATGRLMSRSTSTFAATFVVRRATGARWLNVAVLS